MAGTITGAQVFHRSRGQYKLKVTLLTDSAGDCTIDEVGPAYGKLVAVGYKPGTLDTGADITVTDKQTGAVVFSKDNAGTSNLSFHPTAVITNASGAAISAHANNPNVNRDIYLAGTLQVTVAQGGNAMTGYLYLTIQEGSPQLA
jgi:hypothetical protein